MTASSPVPKSNGDAPSPIPVELKAEKTLLNLRDGVLRLIGIPFFGFVIPRLTGLLAGLPLHDLRYWIGSAWFFAVSLLIWQGNRWLLLRQRERVDWFHRPVLKLVLLLAANVFYTAPLTASMLAGWYRYGLGRPVDWRTIEVVALTNVIAVLFITHAYETVFLIKEREDDLLRLARLERARLEAELEITRAQIAPHFLFNCLNTLAALIEDSPASAAQFNQHLANVCRYVLQHKSRDLVPLAEELTFFHSFVELTRLRFPSSVMVHLRGFESVDDWFVPPASLQLLLENAIKHSSFDERQPLIVDVVFASGQLIVTNPIRPKSLGHSSTGTGLRNLRERVALTSGQTIEISRDERIFSVSVPAVAGT